MDLEISSGDFQCPDIGEVVQILWNVDKGFLYAEPCTMACWSTEPSDDTLSWCKRFGKHYNIDSAKKANQVLEKYDLFSECGFAEDDY